MKDKTSQDSKYRSNFGNFVTQIHHATILVNDMDESLAFYRDILGMEIFLDYEMNNPDLVQLTGLNSPYQRLVLLNTADSEFVGMVELVQIHSFLKKNIRKESVSSSGLFALSFKVKDIERKYEYLVRNGIQFRSPPMELHIGDFHMKACFFFDPNGVNLELIEFLTKT